MKTIAIIQARMGSSRLPGKVLRDIGGQPMLVHVIERARRASTLSAIVVATTTHPSDDPVAELCQARGYLFLRGSLFDVLDRYYQAALSYAPDVVVRITADCPVIDPDVIDQTVRLITDNHSLKTDFACNRLPPPWTRTFPIGLDVEVCTFAALERSWKESTETFHREHVMPYLYEGANLMPETPYLARGTSQRGFRIAQLHTMPDYGSLRWTVDTPEDLELLRAIYARFDNRDDFSWLDVLALWQREPQLASINADVQHKKLYDIDERTGKAG